MAHNRKLGTNRRPHNGNIHDMQNESEAYGKYRIANALHYNFITDAVKISGSNLKTGNHLIINRTT